MEQNALISVIVPVYNVADFLPRCLDSLLGQTYPHFEALLVDDGSTDGSGDICDAYARRDPRFRVFHKENGGLSSARNEGLAHMRGAYVAFIDSDDFVAADYLATLHGCAVQNGAQLVCCNYTVISPDGICSAPTDRRVLTARKISDRLSFLWDIARQQEYYTHAVWAALFAAELVRHRRFKPYPYAEDYPFMFDILSAAPAAYLLADYAGYFYLRRSGSLTGATPIVKRYFHHLQVDGDCYAALQDIPQELRQLFYRRYAARIHQCAYATVHIKDGALRQAYRQTVRQHLQSLLPLQPTLPAALRCCLTLYHRTPQLYFLLARLNEALHQHT